MNTTRRAARAATLLSALLLIWSTLACSGMEYVPETRPVPVPATDPNPHGSDGDSHSALLLDIAHRCQSSSPLCSILHEAGEAPDPRQNQVRLGVAMECVNPVRITWPSQLRKAMDEGFKTEQLGVIGLHIDGETARLFPIEAESPAEQVGMDSAVRRINRCLGRGCKGLVLDADLQGYVAGGASDRRTLTRDAEGHLTATHPGKLPWSISYAEVDGLGWWIVVETREPDDTSCQWMNVFPDVRTRASDS